MAKMTLGPMASAISGSIGGTTYSRNRYGVYARRRAIPVQPNTPFQLNIRALLANISQQFKNLTTDQIQSWTTWAATNPIVDVLGNQQILQANSCFIKLNHRLLQAGDTIINDPPLKSPPAPLTSLSLQITASPLAVKLVFAPTPLETDARLQVNAAIVDTTTKKYVKNLIKTVVYSAKAATSPLDITAALTNRFGTLQSGQSIILTAATFDSTTGLISLPLAASGVIP
jgi:hypothetical protein